jgi:hypothetical protein
MDGRRDFDWGRASGWRGVAGFVEQQLTLVSGRRALALRRFKEEAVLAHVVRSPHTITHFIGAAYFERGHGYSNGRAYL